MGKRQETRDRTERLIVEIGRRHLAEAGAAGLSVRAIARELGMVSSALYRYVASRDDLLTVLLVDAYTDLADAVDRARDTAGPAFADRFAAIGRAARGWAVAHPSRWALLYGSPVPGYRAPAEATVGPGTRVIATLFEVVETGVTTGELVVTKATVAQSLSADFDAIRREFALNVDDMTMMKCVTLWAGLVGAISVEVFGGYGADTWTDPAEVFDGQLAQLAAMLTGRES